jgi:feruloyl esterase
VDASGGHAAADGFVRFFTVPGMRHCSGGPGPNSFDSLGALEQWVEHGEAPDRIIATHRTNGVVDRTRPLCPYPQVARYLGTGSIDDAVNFVCKMPERRKTAP